MSELLIVGLYLASVLPQLFVPFIFIFGIVTLILVARSLILSTEENIPFSETLDTSWFKRIAGAFLITVFLAVLMPDKETIYLMMGIGVGSEFVESVEGSEMLGSVQDLIQLELKSMIEEKKGKIGNDSDSGKDPS